MSRTTLHTWRGKTHIALDVSKISHFTSGDKYVTAHYPGGGEFILPNRETLKALAEEFAGEFIRVHRMALARRSLAAYLSERGDRPWRCAYLHLRYDSAKLPVSAQYLGAVQALLGQQEVA